MKLSELKRLYASGTSIKTLGELADLPVGEIKYALGLPAVGRPNKLDRSGWQDLYDTGKNDREISEQVRCDKQTVRNWRIENNLPSQRERRANT